MHFDISTWDVCTTDEFINDIATDPIFVLRPVATGLSAGLVSYSSPHMIYGTYWGYAGHGPSYAGYGYPRYIDYTRYSYGGQSGIAPRPIPFEDEYVNRWHVGNRQDTPPPPDYYTITFLLMDGYIPGYGVGPIVRTNRVPGYEIGTGGPLPIVAAHDQYGTPTADPILPPLWIDGAVRFYGWREVDTAGNALVPGSVPLTTAQVAELIVNGNRYFKAIYGLWFDFIKTNMQIYDTTQVIAPRNGAVFILEWFDSDPLVNDWVVLYTTQPSGSCTTPGRVVIGNTHNPLLETADIMSHHSFTHLYPMRLREVVPPVGYQAPFGHWYLAFHDWQIMNIYHSGDAPPFITISGVRHVGNRIDFALPLTGGRGFNTLMLYALGAVLLGTAVAALFWLQAHKKARKI